MTFKPMKGADADLSRLVFPYMVTPKLDGHRCLIKDGVALTSALKPFPNQYIQGYFSSRKWDGLDGELIVGPATDPDVFRRTSSGVRKASGEPDFTFHVFDIWNAAVFDTPPTAAERYSRLFAMRERGDFRHTRIEVVKRILVTDEVELLGVEQRYLEQGYEGVMLRHPHSPYKFGRASVTENYLLKLKRFADAEAEIIGVVEQQHNTNEATTNNLGRTQRSSAKAGKVGKGTLGALKARVLNGKFAGVEFEVGTGFDDALRRKLWFCREHVNGLVFTFKYQDVGGYDKPRIPVFKAFRNKEEVECLPGT